MLPNSVFYAYALSFSPACTTLFADCVMKWQQ